MMKKDFMKYDLSVEQEIRDAFNHLDRVEREAFIRAALRKYR
jgi:hypothetical protein